MMPFAAEEFSGPANIPCHEHVVIRTWRMRNLFSFGCFALLALQGIRASDHEELLTPDASPERAIGHYIDAGLQRAGVTPAPQADDANLLRRTMLDLVGRPPTALEAKEYLTS